MNNNMEDKRIFKIGNTVLTNESEPFIIAEVGINHNGELERAYEMIRVAKDAGVDAVKFQTFKSEEFIADKEQTFTYTSQGKSVTESMYQMFKRYEFTEDEWKKIKLKCDEENILFLSTPQNKTDLDLLLKIGISAIKIGSDDFTNIPLIKEYKKTKLPIIMSCGMSDLSEVFHSLETVGFYEGYPVALLLCTSEYPTPNDHVNLLKLKTLRGAFENLLLGFSDHTQGPQSSSLAVALGAVIFEKHFTLDQDLPGPDHWFSENPESLKVWCESIRTSHKILGSPVVRPTVQEKENRLLARRSIVAISDIQIGETLNEKNTGLKRPGNGIPPIMFDEVLGRKSQKFIPKGNLIKWEELA